MFYVKTYCPLHQISQPVVFLYDEGEQRNFSVHGRSSKVIIVIKIPWQHYLLGPGYRGHSASIRKNEKLSYLVCLSRKVKRLSHHTFLCLIITTMP